jgi:hypothetical protein
MQKQAASGKAWLLWLLSLCLSLGACARKEGKKEVEPDKEATATETAPAHAPPRYEGEVINNEPYRFRLAQPGAEWQLLEGSEARQISVDAQVAAVVASGLTAVVIVEHAPNVSLEEMGNLLLDSMPIEEKEISERETIEYVGLPTIAYQLSGNVNEIPMDYAGRIFMRDKYAYQVVAFAPRGAAKAEELANFFASFSLLEGEIRPIQQDMTSPNMVGVGWRLKEGVFESAISGLRVAPSGGWRAVVGAEARRMNADAEVVLIHQAPEAYFLVIPELIGEASPKVYLKDRIESTAANMKGSVERETVTGRLLGKAVDVTILSGGEVPWTFQVSVAFEKEWAVQATGWYTAALAEEGQKALRDAMGAVSLMPTKEVKALRKELLALPDEQDDVGKDFSLRSGVFRDYEHGVQWTKPPGFWELSVGQEARAINPIAQLYGRYSNSALHLLLVAERSMLGVDAESYHQQAFAGAAKNLDLKAKKIGTPSRIGSGAALQTDASTNMGGIDLAYRVVTAVEGNTGVQLHIWGVASGMKRHAAALKAATRELALRKLPPSEERRGVYLDHRLGFSMRLPKQFPHIDSTPPELVGIGSFPTWGVDGKDWVGVLALCAIEAGRDREWAMNLMEKRIRDSYTSIVNAGEASKEETTLLGMPARQLTWKTPGLRLDAYLIRRHHTIYAILATDTSGGTGMIDRAIAGFRLID